MHFLAGNKVTRCSISQSSSFSNLQSNGSEGFTEHPAGRQSNDTAVHYCKDRNLCNGTGRLVDVSTMMILLPASLVLIHNINIYTGCNRRNGPDFGRVFLMLNYTEKPQNTYIQSWTVSEIIAIENCGVPSGPTFYTFDVHRGWFIQCTRWYENASSTIAGSSQAGVLRHHSAFHCDV